jgi:hypothetical protein
MLLPDKAYLLVWCFLQVSVKYQQVGIWKPNGPIGNSFFSRNSNFLFKVVPQILMCITTEPSWQVIRFTNIQQMINRKHIQYHWQVQQNKGMLR